MNDEIKEILDDLDYAKNRERGTITLNQKDINLLLEHITNLQQERDKFKMRCYESFKMIWDNYGVLDKYQIDLMEDILVGRSDE